MPLILSDILDAISKNPHKNVCPIAHSHSAIYKHKSVTATSAASDATSAAASIAASTTSASTVSATATSAAASAIASTTVVPVIISNKPVIVAPPVIAANKTSVDKLTIDMPKSDLLYTDKSSKQAYPAIAKSPVHTTAIPVTTVRPPLRKAKLLILPESLESSELSEVSKLHRVTQNKPIFEKPHLLVDTRYIEKKRLATTPKPAEKSLSIDKTISAINRLTEKSNDPLVIGLELFDPLYEDSPQITKNKIEKEYAVYMESCIDKYYESESGRRRGWTKTYLNSMIVPRCASGANIDALKKAKVEFEWSKLESDKHISGFLDFICLVKDIRIGVYDPTTTIITVYPAADRKDSDNNDKALYIVNGHTGKLIKQGVPKTNKELADANIMPPPSVITSLNGLTITELNNVATRLGMPELTGKKEDRVKTIALYKLKQRLNDID